MSPRADLLVDFSVHEHNDDAFLVDSLESDMVEGIFPVGTVFAPTPQCLLEVYLLLLIREAYD